MKLLRRQQSDDNDTSHKLGFKMGAEVKFSHRFFANHGVKYIELGKGVIQGKMMPDKNSLPKLLVRFPYHKEFYTEPLLHQLLATSRVESDKRISALLEIHPVYLEKA